MPIASGRTAARDRLARRVERAIQNVERLVLDPARLGIVLRNLAIAAAEHAAVRGDHETGGAGGAGIDRENGLHGAKATMESYTATISSGRMRLRRSGKCSSRKRMSARSSG